eukprot:CAMPEP_0170101072 /NCGR_PEP_ID=MMETSP0020_2-20130122/2040_1 /TAXON_ID=98059 /ORGANISM="Dinobryon sp., Strain UTEXLB2267" /LENGTH=555 /DNA_ID=CAMNT_0010324097 /DNA_START=5836 /DNA_END=7503 /DNA_ORIENTATION=-
MKRLHTIERRTILDRITFSVIFAFDYVCKSGTAVEAVAQLFSIIPVYGLTFAFINFAATNTILVAIPGIIILAVVGTCWINSNILYSNSSVDLNIIFPPKNTASTDLVDVPVHPFILEPELFAESIRKAEAAMNNRQIVERNLQNIKMNSVKKLIVVVEAKETIIDSIKLEDSTIDEESKHPLNENSEEEKYAAEYETVDSIVSTGNSKRIRRIGRRFKTFNSPPLSTNEVQPAPVHKAEPIGNDTQDFGISSVNNDPNGTIPSNYTPSKVVADRYIRASKHTKSTRYQNRTRTEIIVKSDESSSNEDDLNIDVEFIDSSLHNEPDSVTKSSPLSGIPTMNIISHSIETPATPSVAAEVNFTTKESIFVENGDENRAATATNSRMSVMKGLRKPNVAIRRSTRQLSAFAPTAGLTKPTFPRSSSRAMTNSSQISTSTLGSEHDYIEATKERWARNTTHSRTPYSVRSSQQATVNKTIIPLANDKKIEYVESEVNSSLDKANLAIIDIEDNPSSTYQSAQIGFNSLLLSLNEMEVNSSDDSSSDSATDSSNDFEAT